MTTKGRGGGFFNTLKPIEHGAGDHKGSSNKLINFEEDELNDLNDISMIRGLPQGG
jgi:hypothetical protein